MKYTEFNINLMLEKVTEFLKQSNAIEGVYDQNSLDQALLAWQYLINEETLSIPVILKTHKILMLNQLLKPDEKGYLRKVPVFIGGKEAPSWKLIPTELANWIERMNEDLPDVDEKYAEMVTKELHVEYEMIHPFVDGNGRTGRMFMNWWRIKNGLPILIINEGKEQHEYYKWFQ